MVFVIEDAKGRIVGQYEVYPVSLTPWGVKFCSQGLNLAPHLQGKGLSRLIYRHMLEIMKVDRALRSPSHQVLPAIENLSIQPVEKRSVRYQSDFSSMEAPLLPSR